MKVDKMFEEISEKTSFINSEILENDYDKVLNNRPINDKYYVLKDNYRRKRTFI